MAGPVGIVMKNPYFISTIILVCGVPLALCMLFWALPFGSIGPMIPLTGVVNLIALPPILYFGIEKALQIKKWKPVLALCSLILGVLFSVLGMNVFIGLTWLFGIKDYQLM
jgi:hypothetical protein